MKKRIFCIAFFLAIAAGCKKATLLVYNDIARVQLTDTTAQSATFVYDDASVVRDTEYIKVNTIGDIAHYDRQVTLEQVPEYDYTYVRDSVTNQVIDTVATVRPFQAVPGVHYLALNDPSIQSMMVVKGDSVTASIPIVLLRDTSLKTNSYRLRVRLVANDKFGLGESQSREKTLIFSDHLERFESWRVDNTSAPAYITFGKYSTGKHQFMIDILKVNIDEAWYKAAMAAGALTQYQNMLKLALTQFNTNPDNIASGKAPVRETSSPTSAAITF